MSDRPCENITAIIFRGAILYTFWYHPMDITGGHLMGFLYMFMLMLQGSLFFTRIHVNRYWTIVSEVSVVAHGVMVAYLAHEGWPFFLAGFLGMFVITQMHGLGLSRRARWVIGIAYIVSMAVIYSETIGLERLAGAGLIPLIEFVLVAIVSVIVVALSWLFGARRSVPAPGN